MKWIKIAMFLSSAVIVSSCSSPVYIQKDESANLAKYHTYMWVETQRDQNDKRRNTSAFAEVAIHNAADNVLSKRGWREVTSNPDVLLSYDVLVQRGTQTQNDPLYTQPFSRVFYNPYSRRWGTIYYPSQFMGYDTYETPVREGTLTITMVDANNDKALWQAWTTEQLNSRKMTDAEASKAVKRIFKKLD
jgi:hypothetical protein